ncbi:MAG TPA: hypothetical protein VK981_09925, partial [Ramlibacter sp.]|nr:hypothetical protein [Ramlibacter sp.]
MPTIRPATTAPQSDPTPPSTMMRNAGTTASTPTCGRMPQIGAIIKAGAHDSEMVRALGVNLPKLRLLVFAIGVGLAALAGVVMAPIWG